MSTSAAAATPGNSSKKRPLSDTGEEEQAHPNIPSSTVGYIWGAVSSVFKRRRTSVSPTSLAEKHLGGNAGTVGGPSSGHGGHGRSPLPRLNLSQGGGPRRFATSSPTSGGQTAAGTQTDGGVGPAAAAAATAGAGVTFAQQAQQHGQVQSAQRPGLVQRQQTPATASMQAAASSAAAAAGSLNVEGVAPFSVGTGGGRAAGGRRVAFSPDAGQATAGAAAVPATAAKSPAPAAARTPRRVGAAGTAYRIPSRTHARGALTARSARTTQGKRFIGTASNSIASRPTSVRRYRYRPKSTLLTRSSRSMVKSTNGRGGMSMSNADRLRRNRMNDEVVRRILKTSRDLYNPPRHPPAASASAGQLTNGHGSATAGGQLFGPVKYSRIFGTNQTGSRMPTAPIRGSFAASSAAGASVAGDGHHHVHFAADSRYPQRILGTGQSGSRLPSEPFGGFEFSSQFSSLLAIDVRHRFDAGVSVAGSPSAGRGGGAVPYGFMPKKDEGASGMGGGTRTLDKARRSAAAAAAASPKAKAPSKSPAPAAGAPAAAASAPAPPPAGGGWGANMFRKPGEWKCEVCASSNPKDKMKCMACETAKPGSDAGGAAAGAGGGAGGGGAAAIKPASTGGFTFGVAPAPAAAAVTAPSAASAGAAASPAGSSGWTCKCASSNPPGVLKCLSCGSDKDDVDGSAKKKKKKAVPGGFTFGTAPTPTAKDDDEKKRKEGGAAAPAGGGFVFGAAPSAAVAAAPAKKDDKPAPAAGGFVFGGAANKSSEKKDMHGASASGRGQNQFAMSSYVESQDTQEFGQNQFASQDSQEFERLLERIAANDPYIISVALYSQDIGGEQVRRLAEALRGNTHVTWLLLQHNSITAEGARTLADVLFTNSTITELSIGGNSIGDEGGRALLDLLQVNSSITTLRMWDNDINGDLDAKIQKLVDINRNAPNPEYMQRLKVELRIGWMLDSEDRSEHVAAVTLAMDEIRNSADDERLLRLGIFTDAERRRRLLQLLLGRSERGVDVAASVDVATGKILYGYAAECGAAPCVLMNLLRAHPSLCECRDIRHRLYPFMLLATVPRARVGDVMEALLLNPSLVTSGISNRK